MQPVDTSMKFNVGDKVQMPGVPIPPVEVLELGECSDCDPCDLGGQVFRFKDPNSGEDDWMHSSEFRPVLSDAADTE